MNIKELITPHLKEGEHYAGIILGQNGAPDYHLVLLPGERDKRMTWQAAVDMAKELGGQLPTRREQSLLFTNLKGEFEETWHWSGETHESDPSYAWFQYFDDGSQDLTRKSHDLRARAVRRLEI